MALHTMNKKSNRQTVVCKCIFSTERNNITPVYNERPASLKATQTTNYLKLYVIIFFDIENGFVGLLGI